MKKLVIDDYFGSEYLTSGCTKDNFIFENCPIELLNVAKTSLTRNCNGVQSCCVEFSSQELLDINDILDQLEGDYAKKLISRDFVCCKIMQSLLNQSKDMDEYNRITDIINVFLLNNVDGIKSLHCECPMPYDITHKAKVMGNIELNFFMYGKTDKYTQQAINNFVSSREPYSIKIFLSEQMSTVYDQLGNFIQSPHDYMTRDVNKYIDFVDIDEYSNID